MKNTLLENTLLKNTLLEYTLWKNTLLENTLLKIHIPKTLRKYTFRKYTQKIHFWKIHFGKYTFLIIIQKYDRLTAGLTWVGARDTTVFKKKQKKEKYHLPYSSLNDVGHNEEADGCGCVGSFPAQIWSLTLTKKD